MRDFLKYAAASALGTLVGLFSLIFLLSLGAVGLVSILLASSSKETVPEVKEKSVLVFDLSTDIVDAIPSSGATIVFEETFSGESRRAVSLYNALHAIEAAAKDDKITGIYLTGNTLEGFATLQELRSALEKFKAADKPIIAYNTGWTERDYYLASIADTVYLNPVGAIELNGFRAEVQFLAGALDKYGIGVQVLRVGRYKSAVEPFIRESSSPEEQQQTQALLSDLWQDFLKAVGSGRSLTPQKLQQVADAGGLLMAEDAKAAGLVDKVAFYDEVLKVLQDQTDATDATGSEDETEDSFPKISLSAYADIAKENSQNLFKDDTIAIVYAEGEIVTGEGVSTGYITDGGLTESLRKVRRNQDIKAVVLRVNSPGGSALASEIIAREVKLLAAEKPVIISMGDYAASGGYMIAAPAAKIFASPSTITGSIGVFGLLLNVKEIANRNGVTWDVIKTAKFADIDTVSRPQTEAELALQQDSVNALYDRFISLVAAGRKVTKERVNQVAQGRVWSGSDAAQVKLVDQIGGLNEALRAAAAAAKIKDWQVQEFPEPPSLEEQIIDNLLGTGIVSRLPWTNDPISEEILKLKKELQILGSMNDPNNLYLRLPFTTAIE